MNPKAVIVGVGNRLRGDDAVGCLALDELGSLTAPRSLDGVDLIDAGTVPENQIEPIARLSPDRILFIDACDFGGEPGEIRLFKGEETDRLAGGLVSTHTLPLNLIAGLLSQKAKAKVSLLGVQPANLEFNTGLSEPVAQALPAVVSLAREWVRLPTGGHFSPPPTHKRTGS